jgi:hypothetical protein
MSFFKKSKIDLKKHYITYSASACAISAALPLCFGWMFLVLREREHYAADCIFAIEDSKDGRESWEAILHNSWLVLFGGCFG